MASIRRWLGFGEETHNKAGLDLIDRFLRGT
jgi:hypothetical protein